MSNASLPEGIELWPLVQWENKHQNFTHNFTSNASLKLTLPDSITDTAELYKATTENFMWLIQTAIDNNSTMRGMGTGWSFSEVAICPGGAIDTRSLSLSFVLQDSFVAPAFLSSGKKSSDLFFVQCGMSVLQLNEKLEAIGRSLKASGASNGQSIAGATSTGTHGSAFKFGAVHDSIIGLHVITGANKHVWIERASNPVASDAFIAWLGAEKIQDDDTFNAAVVSFGSFGFIHGVLLETDPIFLLEDHSLGEVVYDQAFITAMTTLDFTGIEKLMPYPDGTPGKELYHFEVLINPQSFEPDNPDKGIFVKALYKTAYVKDYAKKIPDTKGFIYGDNTLGLIQTILDALGSHIGAAVIPSLVNVMMPLAFKPGPPTFGTIGDTFNNTSIRGSAASAAIGLNCADADRVLREIIVQNGKTPFPGAVGFRFVKGTKALLAFTHYPLTCILEMDGVECKEARDFFETIWNRLDELNIPFTMHWGKINFGMNAARIRKMYGDDTVNKWISCREKVLDEDTRKVFTNAFMQNCGLA